MQVIVPPLYLGIDLILLVTEYSLDRVVPNQRVGLYVPVPDHVGRRLRYESQPFVGAFHGSLGLPLIGYVNPDRYGGDNLSIRIDYGRRAHTDEAVGTVSSLNSDLFAAHGLRGGHRA